MGNKSSKPKLPPLKGIDIDLPRYMGVWYEIARLPNKFQEDHTIGRATYELASPVSFTVVNESLYPILNNQGHFEEATKVERGMGFVGSRPGEVEVAFSFWQSLITRSPNYIVLAVSPAYDFACIGTPDRSCAWIMSRSHRDALNDMVVAQYTKILEDNGFDVARLKRCRERSRRSTHSLE